MPYHMRSDERKTFATHRCVFRELHRAVRKSGPILRLPSPPCYYMKGGTRSTGTKHLPLTNAFNVDQQTGGFSYCRWSTSACTLELKRLLLTITISAGHITHYGDAVRVGVFVSLHDITRKEIRDLKIPGT